MPANQWSKKRERQYEHIRDQQREQGKSEAEAEELAARVVNKERARSGEAKSASRSSTKDPKSSYERGGERSGTRRAKGPTRDQLYNEAKQMGIEGRSDMTKDQLQHAIAGKKGSR